LPIGYVVVHRPRLQSYTVRIDGGGVVVPVGAGQVEE